MICILVKNGDVETKTSLEIKHHFNFKPSVPLVKVMLHIVVHKVHPFVRNANIFLLNSNVKRLENPQTRNRQSARKSFSIHNCNWRLEERRDQRTLSKKTNAREQNARCKCNKGKDTR